MMDNEDDDPFNPFAKVAMATLVGEEGDDKKTTGTNATSSSSSGAAFHAKYDVPVDNTAVPAATVLEFESFNLATDKEDRRSTPNVPEGNHPFYTLEYYMKFFNVDTQDVGYRMLCSIMPWKGRYIAKLDGNPDIYGPFWIATTVVFVMFVTGNLASSIEAAQRGETGSADFGKLSVAASIVYSYVFLLPLLLWLALYYYKLAISLLELICIYGYSLSVYIPISIICVLPYDIVKWTLAGTAFLLSGCFLARAIYDKLKDTDKKSAILVAFVALLGHAGLTLIFKFVFFSYY